MMRSRESSGLKRKLYLVYHQDGLLEVVMGAVLLILACVMLSQQVAFIGLIGIPAAMYLPLKQQISLPRIGHIRFTSERESRKKLALALVFGLLAFAVALGFYPILKGVSRQTWTAVEAILPLVFGGALGVVLAGLGYVLKAARFYLYGVLGLVLVLIVYVAGGRTGLPVGLLGVVVEGVGLLNLTRFIRAYPPTDDGQDG
jgi:hypothetical protein